MKKFFTFLVGLFVVVTFAMAQAPEGVFAKASAAPVIDGVVDDVWDEATVYNIETPQSGKVPTLGQPGETTWQGLWNEDGVFILLKVTDDEFYPAYAIPTTNTWEYDKPELYFDVNSDLLDGKGPNPNKAGFEGHHQFAPPFVDGKIDGTPIEETNDAGTYVYATMVEGSNYIAEYFIPYSRLTDRDGQPVALFNPVGFDVSIIDRDPGDSGRRDMVWANDGSGGGGAWENMDNSGIITFEGAEEPIEINTLAITGPAEITTDNGTTQLSATVTPADATQKYKWVLTNGTGRATINGTGLITAERNGTVTVKAVSADEFVNSDELTVTISGQIITLEEISLIKNSDFIKGTDQLESWGFTKKEVFSVEDGWLKAICTPQTYRWDINVNQSIAIADVTTKYIIKFKAYASVDMAVPLVNEDATYDYVKNGVSTAGYGANSDWTIPVTTEPQWFVIDVVFPEYKADSKYAISFQPGLLEGTFYLDSVYMYKEADLALVSTSSRSIASTKMSVYPNPVVNELTVSMTASNGKVAIYNSIGQKVMEKVSTGTIAKFNVSSLKKGMYFVRLDDGTTQKFIK